MQCTADIVEQLWARHETLISTDHGAKYQVIFSRPHSFFDLIIADKRESIGFITLKDESKGIYSIVNDTEINFHPSFINTPGHGIEVKEKYRKRGIGGALISLGVGIIKKYRQANQKSKRFMIVASNITSEGLGCYRNFGFNVREGMSVSAAYYTNYKMMPEINILPARVSFLKRLRGRLKLIK